MKRMMGMVAGGLAMAVVAGCCACSEKDDGFGAVRGEFDKYYKQITGQAAPAGALRLVVDAKVSTNGKDAYTIKSEAKGVVVTGSNLRSLYYGVYDLLERRGGCHWFWDGDVVPKKATIDLAGLDVKEEAQFEYRGLRYFAHRGLTRFQAEHWGLEDWKKEIDWCLKRRLNVCMLRIGQDDLFQRTFPDVVGYPDPSVDLPGHGEGYDNRTLFWSLQYRGKLRQDLQAYALDRGIMVPEDFGTMTHWYSRTPEDYLDKMKPPFLPQSTSGYAEKNGLVWDIRDEKWVYQYWKLTTTAVKEYNRTGPDQLLHTIGLGERRCFTNRQDNFNLKVEALDKFLKRAHTDYPDAKVLLAGWDFYFTWHPEEVQALLKKLDPKRDIIWDYEGDATRDYRPEMKDIGGNNFTKWGVVGKFPYTFSIFLAFEDALDTRANYPLIEERQKIVQNDPACAGYIFWPESSHTDTLLLRYFTANAWTKGGVPSAKVLDEFCSSRYGADAATWKAIWDKALPLSYMLDWGGNYAKMALQADNIRDDGKGCFAKDYTVVNQNAAPILRALAKLDWKKTTFTERDAIDLARMVGDRAFIAAYVQFMKAYRAWQSGKGTAALVVRYASAVKALAAGMADTLALHTDYSMAESYERLNAIEKITNPNFANVLIDNATCGYCASHQYEAAAYWYKPYYTQRTDAILKKMGDNDHSEVKGLPAFWKMRKTAMFAKPLAQMRPSLARTQANYVKTLEAMAAAADRLSTK